MLKTIMAGCLAVVLCGCTFSVYDHYYEPVDVIYKTKTVRYYHPVRQKYVYKKKRRVMRKHRHTRPGHYYWHRH